VGAGQITTSEAHKMRLAWLGFDWVELEFLAFVLGEEATGLDTPSWEMAR